MASNSKFLAELLDSNGDVNTANLDNLSSTLGTASTNDTGDFLQVSNNLSDLNDAGTARSSLGLGTAATTAATDYATAAQGTKADSALQLNDLVINLPPAILSITGIIFDQFPSDISVSLYNPTSTVSVNYLKDGVVLVTETNISVTNGTISLTTPSIIYNLVYDTIIEFEVINSTGLPSSNRVSKIIQRSPTGGTISISGNYRYHNFTSSGTFSTYSVDWPVDYLIVAGGGGGGRYVGGGGGAGGLLQNSTTISANSNISITVGAGGAGQGTYATDSSFGTIATAIRGGFGGDIDGDINGQSGGSGGGGGAYPYNPSGTGGSGTIGQGYYGANASDRGGGGGGASQAGQSYNGGDGLDYSTWATATATGDNGYYAGGGGGGSYYNSSDTSSGGAGGGGDSAYSGSSGQSNTGGGGGGGGGGSTAQEGPPGNGGSGIVIIRYQIT
jgi:hypothetical protein